MSLLSAVLETINDEWLSQPGPDINGEVDNVLTVAHIHPSLAAAIEANGEKLPEEFDPNVFNQYEDDSYCTVEIVIQEQDHLISYSYE